MENTFLNYPDWQDTADTIHLFLQLAGKVKVKRCTTRPEWAACVTLSVTGWTYNGFDTRR